MEVYIEQLNRLLQTSSNVALLLKHLPPCPYISLLPKTSLFHACCFPLDPLSISSLMLGLASSNLGGTSGLQIHLTPKSNHIVTASWQCPSCLPPLYLPEQSLTLSANALPLICLSNSSSSSEDRFKFLLPQGHLIHQPEVSFMSQRPHNDL